MHLITFSPSDVREHVWFTWGNCSLSSVGFNLCAPPWLDLKRHCRSIWLLTWQYPTMSNEWGKDARDL